MKLIGFKELNGCNSCLESLHSNISDVEYENKEQILNYLKKETFIFVRLDILRDIFNIRVKNALKSVANVKKYGIIKENTDS